MCHSFFASELVASLFLLSPWLYCTWFSLCPYLLGPLLWFFLLVPHWSGCSWCPSGSSFLPFLSEIRQSAFPRAGLCRVFYEEKSTFWVCLLLFFLKVIMVIPALRLVALVAVLCWACLLYRRCVLKVRGCSRGVEKKNRKKKSCHLFLSEKDSIVSLSVSRHFCPSVRTDIRAFRGSSIFFDLSVSSRLQASFVHVHVFRGPRRLQAAFRYLPCWYDWL